METALKSMPDVKPEIIRAGLLENNHGSLRAWCRKHNVNYNSAWAAMNLRRHGAKSKRILAMLRRDACV